MGTYTKPLDLYKGQMARFEKMKGNMVRGHRDIAEGGRDDMREMTSGSISSKQLRQLGHPFGRGVSSQKSTPTGLMRGASKARAQKILGRTNIPPLPINRQSGRLHGMIFMKRSRGGLQSFDIGSASKNQWVLIPSGTKKMIGRGLLGGGLLTKRWRARNKAFFDTFVRKQRAS